MAKRRDEVARAASRRRFRILLVLGAVIASVAAVIGTLLSPAFDVDRVEVRGAAHTSLAAVLSATDLDEQGHPMISLDRFALARRVERLPWVDSATVTRRWPNVVRITVVERVPLGVIGVPGGVALVDHAGRVLATATEPPANTFAVAVAPNDAIPGPGRTVPLAVRGALRILGAMSKDLSARVEGARRVAGTPATYELALRGGVTVRLGEAERIVDKLAAAEAVLAGPHAAGTIIDVRVPRSPTVTKPQVTATTISKS